MRIGMDNERQEAVYPGSIQDHGASEAGHCSTEEACITCGDLALPLEVVEVDSERGLALCRDEQGRRESVETALVLPVEPGDHLLVHAGTAISKLNAPATGMPGREAEDMPVMSESHADPRSSASPQGEARGDAVEVGSA